MRTVRARELCRALKDVGLRPTAFSDPPTQCGDPSPLVRAITPHVTGGNAPLRRRLTTRDGASGRAAPRGFSPAPRCLLLPRAVPSDRRRVRFSPCHAMGHGSAQNSEDQKAQKEYVEPHAGPSAVRQPDCLRPNPAELFEALQRSPGRPGAPSDRSTHCGTPLAR
jgi:hypothetical protein